MHYQSPRRTLFGASRTSPALFTAFLILMGTSAPTVSAQFTVIPASAPQTSPKLGTNLTAVVDYTREWPFLDAFKIARTWISQEQGLPWGMGPALALTSDGWPAALLPGQYAETLIYDNNTGSAADYPTGQYIVLYDGEGTIQFDLQSASIVSQEPGRMVVNVPSALYGIYLEITQTNPLNPIRNIRLITPGFENTYGANPFHPTFLAKLKGYRALRFMEWMQTNTSTAVNWSDRPEVSDFSYTRRGVPLEVVIQLANQTGASPWFNIPHMASDDYVRQFATLIKYQLNPSIKFYLEYSNETWNSEFSQTAYVQAQGLLQGLSTDPTTAGAYYTALRSTHIFTIFQQVFGDTSRFVRVIGSQAANPWLQAETLTYKNAYQTADALAIAPYFSDCSDASIGGWGPTGDPSTQAKVDAMSVAGVLKIEKEHIQNCALAEMNASFAVASLYNLKLVAYEGGQSEVGIGAAQSDTTMAALFAAANRDPGMGALYDTYLQNWKNAGGDLFMHFTDVSAYTIYGNFGTLERQDQDPATAPKYLSLMRFAAANN